MIDILSHVHHVDRLSDAQRRLDVRLAADRRDLEDFAPVPEIMSREIPASQVDRLVNAAIEVDRAFALSLERMDLASRFASLCEPYATDYTRRAFCGGGESVGGLIRG